MRTFLFTTKEMRLHPRLRLAHTRAKPKMINYNFRFYQIMCDISIAIELLC